jgi:uncharacterized membrane protein SpoIIM required for sporulation
MREAQFLKQNAEKWKQYETEVNHFDNPDTFADRFVELTDDLAYSRTFYPNSNTSRYLNGITSLFHQKIYRNKKEKSNRIWSFWQFELPYIFKQYHRQLLYAFLFFIAFCLVGALSAKYDDSFIRLILGDGYVNMTNENIENGDPFGVYKDQDAVFMFFRIAFNNIRVAFIAFVLGIFFSVGTVILILRNGLMVGAFLQFFFAKGLGQEAVLAIFIHGTIELSVIVIAGCAGLILGNSLLFPKTYSRWDSLLKGGRDGMKIVFGLVPFFLVAAMLESFVTRYYQEMSPWLKLIILGLSLALIIGYFVIYPIMLHKRIRLARERGTDADDQNFQLWLNKKLNSGK